MANVCSINYIGQKFDGNRAEEIAAVHMQVENDFRNLAGVVEANNKINQFVVKNSRSMQDLNKARAAVKTINGHYEKEVIKIGKYQNGAKDYYNVNVAELVKERDYRTKLALEKINGDNYKVVDGEVVNPSDYDGFYQRKAVNLEGTPLDTLEEFFTKAEHMQTIFKDKGIDVYVMLDGDQVEPGQIYADNSTVVSNLRKQGVIGEKTKVISVNPNMMYNDVITHEFAHLFIDAIGGLSNVRVNNAFTKLIGTDIYNKVLESYSELDKDSDKFKKEVLATALGVEGNKVFTTPETKTWWDNFRDWVFTKMQSILGISNKNVINDLAQEMINGNFTATSNVSPDNYFRKTPKLKPNIGTHIKNMTDANREINRTIDGMINTFQNRTGAKVVDININESYDAFRANKNNQRMSQQMFNLGKMQSINKAIGRLNDNHHHTTVIAYVNVAIEGINRNLRELKAIENTIKGKDSFEVDILIKKLQYIQISNESFTLLEKLNINLDTFNLPADIKAELKKGIKEALAEKNDSHNKFISVTREVLTEKLKGIEGLILAEKKEQLEVEYNQNKTNPTGRVIADESKEDFINRVLNETSDEIAEETEQFVQDELLLSVSDVGSIELLLRSEKAINSMTIRLASRVMDKASYNSTKAFLEKRADAQDIFKAYNTKYGSTDMKKMWSHVTQEANGEVYLKSKYDYKFFEEYKAITNKLKEARENVDSTESEIQIIALELETWLKNNTTQIINEEDNIIVRVPTTKWLNKDYASIMSKPDSAEAKMLIFLQQTLAKSDENYNNKMKLGKSPFGNTLPESAVYYRMPSMGKDTVEKAISGDYLANAKDTLERLYKFQDDDPERFGKATLDGDDSFDTKLMRKVIGDTQGDEKHNIPIYFRGKFDTKTSTMDVMTAVMSDFYMSSQFKEKSEIQPLLDLLLVSTANKEVGDTVGIKNLSKMFKVGEDEYRGIVKPGINSNEYEKLKSMIENRLYNISNTDAEFGKIAQTVMAWTGSVMMSLNFFSGVANVMQGKVTNWLESAGANFYDAKNLVNAEKKFFVDMGGWINDLGSVTNESKTRLLLDLLNVQGDFLGVKERYIRSSRGLALASRKSLTAPNTAGEFYTQATLMYAMMDNIKIKDKSGSYLDKEFKPTKDITKAISLDEAITAEKGKLKVHPSVHSTTFSPAANGKIDDILEETRAYVKKVSSDLHGQYDKELAAHAQRSIIGKMGFMFRKWLIPGFDRRWRGTANVVSLKSKWSTYEDLRDEDNRKNRFFSSDLKQFQEGSYTSFIRMMSSLLQEGEALSLVTMSLTNTDTWSQMTDVEKGNVKKTVVEYATIVLTLAAAYILKGLADDIPEDDPAYAAIMLGAFASRRLHMELFAFTNPAEALKLLQSPAASVSLVEKSTRLLGQVASDTMGAVFMGEDFERYERGDMKDQLKMKKYFYDVVPVANQVNRNLDDAVTFLFQNY